MTIKNVIIGFLLLSTTAFAAAKIQNADIKTNAAIDATKLIDGSVSNTELGYINTLTSNVQTQLGNKLDTSAFTDAAVTSKLITGYVSGAGVVAATDTILQAIQKLNGNIAAIVPGTGDVVGPASSVDSEVALFDGVTGKLLKRASATGVAKLSSGVLSASNVDLTSEVTGVLPNANTTAASANTVSAIVTRDGSGDFAAGTITAALTGNASTATALAANPTDCSANQFANAIAANGNLTCAAIASADLPAPAASAIAASDIDWSILLKTGGVYTKTLSANTTFTFSNLAVGTIVVRLTNTASNYTVTWPTMKWSGGAAPVITVGAKDSVCTLIYDGTSTYGSCVLDMF